ncbi:DVU_1553 family AMP-dependent CoA ligase [Azospirillum sp. A39]
MATLDAWTARRMAVPEPLTRRAVEDHQLARLRETLAFVRTASPFYRSRADWPDGPPATLADLARFPFTTPGDLAAAAPPLLAVPQSAVARIVTLDTSGTSGPPKRVFCTEEDLEDTVDFFHHGMALFARPGDRAVIAFPARRPGGVGAGLAAAARRLGVEPVAAEPDRPLEELVALLRAERPAVVFGTPVRLLAAARLAASDGGPAVAPRAVLLSADRVPASLRDALAGLWRCAVFAHWGMTETGLGGALECAAHAGMHLREGDLYVEVVDPDTGTPLPPGAAGEIVVTTLRRRALPLVRYRTGDRGRLLPGPCRCGSVLRRLDGAVERLAGAVALPGGGALTLAALDEALFGLDAVADFGAALEEGGRPRLSLVVATPPARRGRHVCAAVRDRLAGLPALAAPLADGSLALEVALAAGPACRHDGKRRLARRPAGAIPWPRAALFDLDGTLVDSVGDVHAALNEALHAAGEPALPLQAVRRILGGGARALVERALALRGVAPDPRLRELVLARFLALYRPPPLRFTTLCPGAAEVLRVLAERGVRRAVVTNKGEADARAVLARFGLEAAVDTVVGGDAGPPKKPHPGLLLLACRRLGIEPAQAVFVGDGEHDIDAATAAGMAAVAVRGGCSARRVDDLGAARVIDSLWDLPAALLSIKAGDVRPGAESPIFAAAAPDRRAQAG